MQLQQWERKTLAALPSGKVTKLFLFCSLLAHFFNVCNMWCTYSGGNNLPHYLLKSRRWMRFIIMQRCRWKMSAARLCLAILFCTSKVIKVQSQINYLEFFAYYFLTYCIKSYIKLLISCNSVNLQTANIFQDNPQPPLSSKYLLWVYLEAALELMKF